MYVNVAFVTVCLYSAVSLTLVREQRLLRIIIIIIIITIIIIIIIISSSTSSQYFGSHLRRELHAEQIQ